MFKPALLGTTCAGFFVLGSLLGWIMGVTYALPGIPIEVRTVEVSEVPVVNIEGIRDGNLVGDLNGEVRLFLAGDQVLPSEGGDFTHSPEALLTNIRSVFIPEGMNFVASKKGSKYYPIKTAAAKRIAVENRVYFETSAQAEQAGFLPH